MPWADLTDVRCHYELAGAGDPLMMIGGLGSTGAVWDPIAAQLARHFSLICPDNRDIGRSVAKRHASTLHDYSADLIELLDHLQVERAHVMGLSLGGVIAHRFAIEHPDRINRVVLVSCAHTFGPYLREMAVLMGQTLRRFPQPLFARTLELLGTAPMYLDEDPTRLERRVEEHLAQGVPRTSVARQLRCLADTVPYPDEYEVTAPTLVIAGEYDALIPHCYARRMAELIPEARYMLVSDAGHNPFSECPERVLPAIIAFLRGEPEAGQGDGGGAPGVARAAREDRDDGAVPAAPGAAG